MIKLLFIDPVYEFQPHGVMLRKNPDYNDDNDPGAGLRTLTVGYQHVRSLALNHSAKEWAIRAWGGHVVVDTEAWQVCVDMSRLKDAFELEEAKRQSNALDALMRGREFHYELCRRWGEAVAP